MRRRKHQEEAENHERWLVSYADFITLLFAFFVVMYAIGQQDIRKAEKFEKNIRKQFKVLVAKVQAGGGQSGSGGGASGLANPNAGPQELGGAINSFLEGEMSERERTEAIESLRADPDGVRMSLLSANYFNEGSLKIRTEALPALLKIGKVLENSRRTVIIEGHSSSTKEGFGKNAWDVAAIRANQILKYFIKNHGVAEDKILSVSYGKTRPVVSGNDKKNDRIEIFILTKDLQL
ncbi:MAG: flagellar motor protein MotB [Bdellovibrionota bacterium]|nr:flagellar motor protein MotB [Bdellovibrionota bacterium]